MSSKLNSDTCWNALFKLDNYSMKRAKRRRASGWCSPPPQWINKSRTTAVRDISLMGGSNINNTTHQRIAIPSSTCHGVPKCTPLLLPWTKLSPWLDHNVHLTLRRWSPLPRRLLSSCCIMINDCITLTVNLSSAGSISNTKITKWLHNQWSSG